MRLSAALSIYSPANRRRLLIVAGLMVVIVAAIDWWTKPYISLGFLYLFPIMIAGGFLSRTQIVSFAVLCALLQEEFSNLPPGDTWPRLNPLLGGIHRHRLVHLRAVAQSAHGSRSPERSRDPGTGAPRGRRAVAGTGGEQPGGHHHVGLAMEPFCWPMRRPRRCWPPVVPPCRVKTPVRICPLCMPPSSPGTGRTFAPLSSARDTASDGEVFLAGVWFSTYSSSSGNRLAAIFVDLSEDLRSREDLNLDYLSDQHENSDERRFSRDPQPLRRRPGRAQEPGEGQRACAETPTSRRWER